VDRYALLQVFIKFGKVSKLDFLFHKTGPNKGQPRGYAFIQYFNESDAQVALENVNGKLLRGRKLSVTFAHQAPLEQRNGSRQVARRIDARPTFLSMIKSGIHTRSERTDNKIAMMETKLRQMESSTTSSSNSLPPKPPPSAALLNSASRQCRGLGVSLSSRNPAGPTVQRPTTLAEPTTHLGLSADADTTPSASLPTLNTQPEVLNPSMSCKGILPGVKIVKERHK
ncbi:hypothetical protein EV424DRAFT_1321617, partial [Suillus variegatus]